MLTVSARNQFVGVCSSVTQGAVNSEVHIQLPGGNTLVAIITQNSLERLGIATGREVVALIKAPQIILVTDEAGYQLSARNQLKGVVSQIKLGMVNSEVEIVLPGGDLIVSTVTNESVDNLSLKKGESVTAVFKASSVILAVKSVN